MTQQRRESQRDGGKLKRYKKESPDRHCRDKNAYVCVWVYVFGFSDLLFSFRGHAQACHNAISCPLRCLLRSTEI